MPLIGLWTMAIDEFTTKVSQRLSSMSECSSLQVGEIVDNLADVSPFTGLETSYLQSRYLCPALPFVGNNNDVNRG